MLYLVCTMKVLKRNRVLDCKFITYCSLILWYAHTLFSFLTYIYCFRLLIPRKNKDSNKRKARYQKIIVRRNISSTAVRKVLWWTQNIPWIGHKFFPFIQFQFKLHSQKSVTRIFYRFITYIKWYRYLMIAMHAHFANPV